MRYTTKPTKQVLANIKNKYANRAKQGKNSNLNSYDDNEDPNLKKSLASISDEGLG